MTAQIEPRSRKTRGRASETITIGAAAVDVLAAARSAMTLRQLFYALVSIGTIPKAEPAYAKLKRIVKDLREDGTVPWEWLVDHTRAVFQARTFDGVEGLLQDSANLYRRDLMRSQAVAIQLWAESDSIGSVIAEVADRYTIPTFIGRGYGARGYLWSAARDAVAAMEAGKYVSILHVGDHDPSGEDIFRDVEQTLRLYAEAVRSGVPVATVRRWLREDARDSQHLLRDWTSWLEVERLALTPAQIVEFNLPVRPPKASDARTARFTGVGAVEVEALPVDALLAIVEQGIVDRIDERALLIAAQAETSEREIAQRIAGTPIDRLLA